MNVFEWSPLCSAPKFYPMEIYKGWLHFPDDGGASLPSAGRSWGGAGGLEAIGDDYKLVPDELYVCWMSITENKYYKGIFSLPVDSMTKLFKEGFTLKYSKEHGTYNSIKIGLAPGGVIMMWLGGNGKQVEVGRFQAQETAVTIQERYPSSSWAREENGQENYVKFVIRTTEGVAENLAAKGIPYGHWDSCRERFSWRPIIKYNNTASITDEIAMEYFNGEENGLSMEALQENKYQMQPRIKSIECAWSTHRQMLRAIIEMDEDEIFNAYKLVYGNEPQKPGELRVEINQDNTHINAYLHNMDSNHYREAKLQKIRAKILPEQEFYRRFYTVFKDEFKDAK